MESARQAPQDETEAVALPVRSARRAAPQASRGGLGLVLVLVAVGGGVVTMALTGMKDNAIYFEARRRALVSVTGLFSHHSVRRACS